MAPVLAEGPDWVTPLISAGGVVVAAALAALATLVTSRITRRGQDVSARTASAQTDIDALRSAAAASAAAAERSADYAKAVREDAERYRAEVAATRSDYEALRRDFDELRIESRAALDSVIRALRRTLAHLRWYRDGATPPPPRDLETDLYAAEELLAAHDTRTGEVHRVRVHPDRKDPP